MSEGGFRFESRFEGYCERARNLEDIGSRLETIALYEGEESNLSNSNNSPEGILLDRLISILVEEAPEWDPKQKKNLQRLIAAYSTLAFRNLRPDEMLDFFEALAPQFSGNPIQLQPYEANILSRIASRVNIDYQSQQTRFPIPFQVPDITIPRLTEIEDLDVTNLLENSPSETGKKAEYLVGVIERLENKQRVMLLLKLTDEEFEAFQSAQRQHNQQIASEISEFPQALNVSDEEVIKTINAYRSLTPVYTVQAEIRRRNPEYPEVWDEEFDIDPRFVEGDGLPRMRDGKRISYQEAIEFAHFENVRKFYRNRLLPQVTRFNKPLPLNVKTLYDEFKKFQSSLPQKPGNLITLEDLLPVLNYYEFEHEPDNFENCKTHQEVRTQVQFLLDFEGN